MSLIKFKNFSFIYALSNKKIIKDLSFSVNEGDFLLLCGTSGSGKTTLLKQFKKDICPKGMTNGDCIINVSDDDIGYIFQNPENQIVMDTVFDELIFSCEQHGLSTNEIDIKLGEITAFFGIEKLLNKKCHTLSGGEKQLVNLAAVMMINPSLLILDEPLTQLDPVGASDFMNIITKLNKELGITIIICEHNLDIVIPEINKVLFLNINENLFFNATNDFLDHIINKELDFYNSLPTYVQLINKITKTNRYSSFLPSTYPLTINKCRNFIKELSLSSDFDHADALKTNDFSILLKNGYFRYEKNESDIFNNICLKVPHSSIYTIVGGNGAGKSTLFSIISGYRKLYKGKLKVNGKIGYLPQNHSLTFIKNILYDDLLYLLNLNKINDSIIDIIIEKYEFFNGIKEYFYQDPQDLSGGQMQLCAIFKTLLLSPSIILLDEPTKGLDGNQKFLLKKMLTSLKKNNITVVIITHDLDFAADISDFCSMMFNGKIVSTEIPELFFMNNRFYTTSVAKITNNLMPYCVTVDNVLKNI